MDLVQANRIRDLVEGVAGELALCEPGTDQGLVPIFSQLGELIELLELEPQALEIAKSPYDRLSDLLDAAGEMDAALIADLSRRTETLQTACRFWGMDMEVPWSDLVSQQTEVPAPAVEEHVRAEKESGKLGASFTADDLLVLDLDENREILEEFYGEAVEHLDSIEAALLELEDHPGNAEAISSIFRSFHTIKGVAGFLDLRPMQRLAHEVETLLDFVRSGKVRFDQRLVSLVLESRDRLQLHLVQIHEGLSRGLQPDTVIPVADLIARTLEFIPKQGQAVEVDLDDVEPDDDAAHEDFFVQATPAAAAPAESQSPASEVTSRPQAGATTLKTTVRSSIRMDLEKLDGIIDAVGELVIVESQLRDSLAAMGDLDSRVERNLAQLGRITRDLQRSGLSLRMVSLKPVFQKMQRLVRDLAAKCAKRVNFIMEGEDTEMDRSVVEEISDPLVHMIRNSLDHGIEGPEDREAAGKSSVGNLYLRAFYAGDSIVLELKDDGRGINAERVLQKAIDRGLAQPGAKYSHDEIISFIFAPGFSTAEKVTDVSGRGVGMDVVRTNIKKLRGRVDLSSEFGKGSTVRISLPLTMAIIDGMLVRVGTERYIIPVSNVNMTVKPTREQIHTVQNRGRVIRHREQIYRLFSLADFYQLKNSAQKDSQVVVMVESDNETYGLEVDEVLGKQEVVVKHLGSFLHNPDGVAGGAILGDGTIALILDPGALARVDQRSSS